MSFAWPLALAGLVLVPLLLALEVVSRRRRSRFAVSFTNVELLRSVVTRSSSWRRVARTGLLLSALTALLVGLARPQLAVSVPKKDATVALAMDVSGSMVADDVAPNRLAAATSAAQDFVDQLPSTFDVGVVTFSSGADVAVAPTVDRRAVKDALGRLEAGGATAIGEAIESALAATGATASTTTTTAKGGRVILLLSDGANTSGIDPFVAAAHAREAGVRVYTIAFGTQDGVVQDPFGRSQPVPPDPDTLRAVAEDTGGAFFEAADAESLRRVYESIGTRVGSTTEKRDVSFAFAGGAAALLLAAGALSVRTRGPFA